MHPNGCMYQEFIILYGWVAFLGIDIPPFLYPFASWKILGLFSFWAIMNRTAVNIHVHFTSPGQIPKNGNASSQGKWIFNLITNDQTGFQSSCTTLHGYWPCSSAALLYSPWWWGAQGWSWDFTALPDKPAGQVPRPGAGLQCRRALALWPQLPYPSFKKAWAPGEALLDLFWVSGQALRFPFLLGRHFLSSSLWQALCRDRSYF